MTICPMAINKFERSYKDDFVVYSYCLLLRNIVNTLETHKKSQSHI